MDVQGATGPVRQTLSISKGGVDLYEKSKNRDSYRGYIIDDIIYEGDKTGYVVFTNGVEVRAGATHGGRTDDMMRVQIKQTIREHFEKELAIARLPPDQRMKVLSLFFIDWVANYAPSDGVIRRAFIEAYEDLAAMPRYAPLCPLPVAIVHNGYFAQDKNTPKDSAEGRSTRADDEAYTLIMKDKQRLLSLDEPLRFIFSHSALREG